MSGDRGAVMIYYCKQTLIVIMYSMGVHRRFARRTHVMLFKRIFTSFIFIELAAEVWSHVELEADDYFFPLEPVINFCKLADQCQHDFVPVCGQDSLGITRMFNDVCDQYEYNCDEKKQYRHVKMEVCSYEAAAAGKIF